MKKIIAAVLCLVLTIVPFAPRAEAAPTAASDALVEFIKSQEGFVDHVYYAGGYAYIGYGQMVDPSDYPNGITEEQATALLRSTLATIADAVNRYAAGWKTVMNQGQFDAVLSLTYNLGTSWLTKNGKLITALRAGTQLTPVQAADCFGVHCHAGGINEHLIKRRLYEADMFSYGNYTGAHISDYTWLVLKFNGGDADNDIAFFLKGKPYGTLPTAWKSGYYFAGWSTGSAILKPTDVASGKLTVTATWSTTPVTLPDPVEPEPEPTPEPHLSRFPDVPNDAWYLSNVEELADAGVINGYPNGNFGPGDNVTFGEALKLILLAAGVPEQPSRGAHWADGYLAYAIEHRLFSGETGSLDAPASRLLIAHLAANALGLAPGEESPFADCSDPLVAALYGAGIMKGSYEDGKLVYRPGANIVRAEAAAVVYRIREYAAP